MTSPYGCVVLFGQSQHGFGSMAGSLGSFGWRQATYLGNLMGQKALAILDNQGSLALSLDRWPSLVREMQGMRVMESLQMV